VAVIAVGSFPSSDVRRAKPRGKVAEIRRWI
jgi:hypothetical protein